MTPFTDPTTRSIRFAGRLDAATCGDLEQAFGVLSGEDGDIILDLSECSYLSSAGIRILLKTTKHLTARTDRLILAGVTPEVMHVLEIAALTQILHLEPTMQAALAVAEARRTAKSAPRESTVNGHQLLYHPSLKEALTGTYSSTPDVLSFQELGFGAGFGSFSGPDPDPSGSCDFFVTLGSCAGFLPGTEQEGADFRVVTDPEHTGLPVQEALSFGHHPNGFLEVKTTGPILLGELFGAVGELPDPGFTEQSILLALVMNRDPDHPSFSLTLTNNPALSKLVDSLGLLHFRKILTPLQPDAQFGLTFSLGNGVTIPAGASPAELLPHILTFENIESVQPVNPDELLINPLVWLFHANRFIDGRTQRLQIELSPGTQFDSPRPFLARMLYKDSSRLFIDPLHGGYSAQTYQVQSFDNAGRKMRPTVMKVAHRNLISRESERCQKFALPYIFNNCAVTLGSARHGDTMAIRYNFVGIGGEASELRWLTHYYLEHEMDFLEPVFDKIFLQILTPWYGQPVTKTIYPFLDHDPTLTFFPGIYDTVRNLFSVTPNEETISVSGVERSLLNPYRFLKYEYPRLREWGMEYLTGICHGDLNMQNILLDESMNVYLIDFSETRPRAVISDFARLEAIFLVDHAPMDEGSGSDAYVNYLDTLYRSDHLTEIPPAPAALLSLNQVTKNLALTGKMRQYALKSALGDPDPLPYYMALLEWVLPVVCYTVPLPVKRLAMIVSAFLAEKVMERMAGQAT